MPQQAASGPQMYLVWPSFKILGSFTKMLVDLAMLGKGSTGLELTNEEVPQEPQLPATSLILRPTIIGSLPKG